MNRNFLRVLAIVLAISFSAFSKFAITENFMVQVNHGIYQRFHTVTASCITPTTLPCKYDVTDAGKANIPAQASYTPAQIQTFLANGWIVLQPNTPNRLYAN